MCWPKKKKKKPKPTRCCVGIRGKTKKTAINTAWSYYVYHFPPFPLLLSPVAQALLFLAAHFLLLCVSHTYNIRLAALIGKSSYSRLLPRNIYVYLTTPKNNSRRTREDNKSRCDCASGSIRVSVSTVATIPSSQIRKDHGENVSL